MTNPTTPDFDAMRPSELRRLLADFLNVKTRFHIERHADAVAVLDDPLAAMAILHLNKSDPETRDRFRNELYPPSTQPPEERDYMYREHRARDTQALLLAFCKATGLKRAEVRYTTDQLLAMHPVRLEKICRRLGIIKESEQEEALETTRRFLRRRCLSVMRSNAQIGQRAMRHLHQMVSPGRAPWKVDLSIIELALTSNAIIVATILTFQDALQTNADNRELF